MSTQLDQLKTMTVVVADTGIVSEIEKYEPQDATTNPSLVLAAAKTEEGAELVRAAAKSASEAGMGVEAALDEVVVAIGVRILKMVPGKVSTEVDARLSFDKAAMVTKVHTLMGLYKNHGIDARERVLFKLASTWEGIQAARELEADGIKCNLTLLFSMAQARACADAGAFLISPFVGRIADFHKAHNPDKDQEWVNTEACKLVQAIYAEYKAQGTHTVVMGASFRNIDQVRALAGCDRLTVAPKLLAELAASTEPLERKLVAGAAQGEKRAPLAEAAYRWEMCNDVLATEKLNNGIVRFAADAVTLEGMLEQFM